MRPSICSHRVRAPSSVGLDDWSPGAQPGLDRGDLRALPGSWADPLVYMPWAATPGDPRRQANTAPEMLPSARSKTSAPRCSLSRLITTACTLAVYASRRGLLLPPRKTRCRWGASPYRVGLGPTGSTTKGFRSCLLHFPSPLPRLCLAQGTSLRPSLRRCGFYLPGSGRSCSGAGCSGLFFAHFSGSMSRRSERSRTQSCPPRMVEVSSRLMRSSLGHLG